MAARAPAAAGWLALLGGAVVASALLLALFAGDGEMLRDGLAALTAIGLPAAGGVAVLAGRPEFGSGIVAGAGGVALTSGLDHGAHVVFAGIHPLVVLTLAGEVVLVAAGLIAAVGLLRAGRRGAASPARRALFYAVAAVALLTPAWPPHVGGAAAADPAALIAWTLVPPGWFRVTTFAGVVVLVALGALASSLSDRQGMAGVVVAVLVVGVRDLVDGLALRRTLAGSPPPEEVALVVGFVIALAVVGALGLRRGSEETD